MSTHQPDGHGGYDQLLQAAEELLRPPVVEEASSLRRANLQGEKRHYSDVSPTRREKGQTFISFIHNVL